MSLKMHKLSAQFVFKMRSTLAPFEELGQDKGAATSSVENFHPSGNMINAKFLLNLHSRVTVQLTCNCA